MGGPRLRRSLSFSLALFGGSQRGDLRPQVLELGGDRLGFRLLSLACGSVLSFRLGVDVGLQLREALGPALAVARGHAILGHCAREPFGQRDWLLVREVTRRELCPELGSDGPLALA